VFAQVRKGIPLKLGHGFESGHPLVPYVTLYATTAPVHPQNQSWIERQCRASICSDSRKRKYLTLGIGAKVA